MKIHYTVGQLIEKLQELSSDMPVLTNGYEDEYENIMDPNRISVKYKADEPYWSGQFKEARENDSDSFEALVLRREVRL